MEKHSTSLPDGSKYDQVLVSQEDLELPDLFTQLRKIIDDSGIELRILFPNKDSALEFVNRNNDLEIYHGKTTYFEVTHKDREEYLKDFTRDIKDFEVQEVNFLTKQLEELMVNSFAWDFDKEEINGYKARNIRNSIGQSITNKDNHIYTIIQKQSKELLGTITHLYLENEIQGHSLGGRPIGELSKIKNKLEIIIYFSRKTIEEQGLKQTLTFNSSGAAKLYDKLGVRQSSRYGVVIK